MNNPKISIITICYNAEKTIEDTVKSVRNQDYPNVEYIIIDGASKDNTLGILEPYKSSINLLVSEPDKGLYDALNKGMKAATGDIIGILHSDDFYPHQSVLSEIAKQFKQHPDTGAVSSSVKIFKADNFEIPFRTYDATRFKLWQFRFGMQPPHPGFFVTKAALLKTGYFDTSYRISGDFDWLLRVLKVNRTKTVYSQSVSVYMRDGGLSSSGFASKQLMNKEDLIALKNQGIYSNLLFIYLKYFFKIFQLNLFGKRQ
ncbi:MAG: glycosyltransferase family 2 protein [Bacteroidota bacterium]